MDKSPQQQTKAKQNKQYTFIQTLPVGDKKKEKSGLFLTSVSMVILFLDLRVSMQLTGFLDDLYFLMYPPYSPDTNLSFIFMRRAI